ncbi:MAG TPA: cytochrome c biogenesis protein ResB [Gammaproteobacteria bacterium]|nr:cytochrome c biogenesis protein ResB [Gammaproteobacteria bacterium]
MSGETSSPRTRRSILLEFLGSMNLAITILVAVAIAAVIGTVLKQNQPYTDYLIKFGPFWHQVFKDMGLYDVYSTAWFLGLLGFLLVSTSVCIYRNTPTMLRDMRRYRENAQEKTLRTMQNSREWTLERPPEEVEATFDAFMRAEGYRVRSKRNDGHTTLAAMRGGLNRLGYLFTHLGIVVICIGALVDGSAGLKLRVLLGQLKIETRDIPASQVPADSTLTPGEISSFRGSVTIPEHTSTNIVFLDLRNGYLVQQLPFSVELKDFRIQHYPSGQPKEFESDLIIHDDKLKKPLAATIKVNHPLTYRGYTIYQSSFGDGGSHLHLKAWPLDKSSLDPTKLEGTVNKHLKVSTSKGPMTLEFTNFKMYNVFPAPKGSDKKFVNFGPSFIYKLRDASGQAKEYVNYMSPVLQQGRLFYLSGVRNSPAEQYNYLHIPADPKGTPMRFLRFRELLENTARVRKIALRHAGEALAEAKLSDPKLRQNVAESMVRLVKLFDKGGFQAISEHIKANVPAARRPQVAEAYLKVLQSILEAVYVELLHDEGVDTSKGVSQQDATFYQDAVNALAGMGEYDSPFYLQMTGFKEVQASGLQIARAPAKNIVFFGTLMLIVGIFMMFYIVHRRLWAVVRREGNTTRVLFAGSGSRHQRDFSRDFAAMGERLDEHLRS